MDYYPPIHTNAEVVDPNDVINPIEAIVNELKTEISRPIWVIAFLVFLIYLNE
jgi:hypothetical protein